jgi:AmmeMemoRadiSam system protein B
VAGLFYPAGKAALESAVADCFADATPPPGGLERPKALIAPHAGYRFSGPVAASAYRALAPFHQLIRRVVLMGPSHFVPFRGLAVSSAAYFLTPLGPVQLDAGATLALRELSFVWERDDAHAGEHCLEVHLPFLQTALDDFRLVPVVVGDANPPQVGEALEKVWGGDETLIVVSTDLSHYLSYGRAKRVDGETSEAIRRLDPSSIEGNRACGYRALNGLLYLASRRGLRVTVLDERNSGDTSGDRLRVVGYGAYAITA